MNFLNIIIVCETQVYLHKLCSGIQFLTSGGGSKAWRGDVKPWDEEELKLYHDGQGFMSVQMTETSADIVFYDVFGKVLHTWKMSKEFKSAA